MLQRREDDSAADVEWFQSADVVTAGFPCQDLSYAGKGAGLSGERSGLWWQVRRTLRMVRPRFALLENVAALLNRGMGTVLGSLAAIGYDAEWHCIPASYVGAPHRRDRVWILANACSGRRGGEIGWEVQQPWRAQIVGSGEALSNASSSGLSSPEQENLRGTGWREERRTIAKCDWWSSEPDVGRVAHGVPSRVDRIKSLGNGLVPQIPELIGQAILESIKETA